MLWTAEIILFIIGNFLENLYLFTIDLFKTDKLSGNSHLFIDKNRYKFPEIYIRSITGNLYLIIIDIISVKIISIYNSCVYYVI